MLSIGYMNEKSACSVLVWSPVSRVSFKGNIPLSKAHQQCKLTLPGLLPLVTEVTDAFYEE